MIALPTTNVRVGEGSAALATKVFRTGLLAEADAADLGWSRVPLSVLHGDAAERALHNNGAVIRRRARVGAIDVAPLARDEVSGVVVDGEAIPADAVVLAVPHDAAAKLLPDAVEYADQLAGLGTSPIVDIHLVYDRKVCDYPVAAGASSPVQYVFDRTDSSGLSGDGQCLAVSVSAADAERSERGDSLVSRYHAAVIDLFPRAEFAHLLDAVVTREPAATFRGVPGTARLRPGTETTLSGLFVAGAWTDTGWPATMEGAVRSGNRAAWHALRTLGLSRGPSPELAKEAVATIGPDLPAVLERACIAVTPARLARIATLSPELRPIADYHHGFAAADGSPTGSDGGKGFRPACRAVGGGRRRAHRGWRSRRRRGMELVHNFSLIHDDVIDKDTERRHRPTVWSLYGVGAAVIVGDALLVLAQQVIVDPVRVLGEGRAALDGRVAVSRLADATAAMIAGQALDMAFETESDVSVARCLEMEAGKTGALLGCAASIGAVLCGASASTVAVSALDSLRCRARSAVPGG